MSAFSKALKDAENLKPLAQSLIAYKQKMDEQKGRQALIQLLDNINKKQGEMFAPQTEEIRTPTDSFEVKPGSMMESLLKQTSGGGSTDDKMVPLQQGQVTPEKPYNVPIRPQILQPGQKQESGFNVEQRETFNPQKNPQDYRTAMDQRNKYFSEILGRVANDPNIKLEQLGQTLKIADLGVPSAPYISKTETKQLGDFAFTFDEYGRQIGAPKLTKKDDGGWKYDRDKAGEVIIYNVKGQHYMRKQKPNGEENLERVPQSGENKFGVTIDNTSVAEGMRKMRIAQLEGDLDNYMRNFSKLDKEHQVAKTDIDKKKIQDSKGELIRNNIGPTVKEITSAVSQEFPDFYGTVQEFVSRPDLIADPSLIDKVVSDELKAADVPDRMIRLTKSLVKAQIFNSQTLPKY